MTDLETQTALAEETAKLVELATAKHREAMAALQAGNAKLAAALLDECALLADDGHSLAAEADLPIQMDELKTALGQLDDQRAMLAKAIAEQSEPRRLWSNFWPWIILAAAVLLMLMVSA